jgi:coproporphyrinogen III oxidase
MKKYQYIQNLQDQIVAGLEAVEGHAKFSWRSGNVQAEEEHAYWNGNVIEGGVNISAVQNRFDAKNYST